MANAILADVESSGIYQIRNLANGKRYVGSAKCFRIRWNNHLTRLRSGKHHSRHLQSSWSKHGEAAFVFEVLEYAPPADLIDREQVWLDRLDPSYNICPIAGSTFGRRHSPETRRKISDRAKGRKMPERGPEYRRKLSDIHKGRPKPQHVIDALQAGRMAYVPTEDHKRRSAEATRLSYENGTRAREKSEAHRSRIGMAFAKLSDDEVRQIKRLKSLGVTGRELAKMYGSNCGTISEICSGKRYRWVN